MKLKGLEIQFEALGTKLEGLEIESEASKTELESLRTQPDGVGIEFEALGSGLEMLGSELEAFWGSGGGAFHAAARKVGVSARTHFPRPLCLYDTLSNVDADPEPG